MRWWKAPAESPAPVGAQLRENAQRLGAVPSGQHIQHLGANVQEFSARTEQRPAETDSAETTPTDDDELEVDQDALIPGIDLDDDNRPFRTRGGVGELLAGSVVSLLNLRRRRQRSRLEHESSEGIALPGPDVRMVEGHLRSVADTDGATSIDAMLRALPGDYVVTGQTLPSIKFARWIDQHLELHLITAAELPAPWVQIAGPKVWRSPAMIPASANLRPRAPYPTLVTVGHDDEGGTVMVNLEHATELAIHAVNQVDQDVIAAAALELGTVPWATHVTVVLVGGWSELAHVLEPGRARYVPSLTQYTPSAGPEVVFLADRPASDDPALITALEYATAVVYPGNSKSWNIDIDDDVCVLEPIGLPLQVQTLNTSDYALIVEDLRTAQVVGAPPVVLSVVTDDQAEAPRRPRSRSSSAKSMVEDGP